MKKRLPAREKGRPPWTLRIAPYMRKNWGFCDYTSREIVLAKDTQKHGVARQVFLHEMLHKIMPWMDEDAVDDAATQIDDALDIMDSLTNM